MAPLFESREFVDLVLSYLPSLQATQCASVSRLWHEAVGRVHGGALQPIREAMRHGTGILINDERGLTRRAVRLLQYVTEPNIVSGLVTGRSKREFMVVLQQRPVMVMCVDGHTKGYRPFLRPNMHERSAEKLYYQLTGQDVRRAHLFE